MSFDTDKQRRWFFATHPNTEANGHAAPIANAVAIPINWTPTAVGKPWVAEGLDGSRHKFDSLEAANAWRNRQLKRKGVR